MHQPLFPRLVISAAVGALFSCAGAALARHRGASASFHHPVKTCDDLDFQFDERDVSRSEDHFTFPKSATPLEVSAANNGGVEVVGWGGDEYSITACKAAVSGDLLKQISVSVNAGRVMVQGPGGGDWTVYLILKAPKDSALSLQADNGPIGLREVTGKINARSTNGPISVKDCSGDIEAFTQNGPISLSGGDGTINLEARNGPINVALSGSRWGTGGVKAHTENGPLALMVPEGYESGIRVEMSGHSPVHCHAAQCGAAQRTWDDEHRYVQFGGATILVRMSTVNGPVSIESRSGDL